MKRNVSVVKLCLYVSECVCCKIIKELPGLVGSGTPCTSDVSCSEKLNKTYITYISSVSPTVHDIITRN